MVEHRETLFHAAACLSRRLSQTLRDALAPVGLQPAQFSALLEIADDEGLTQAQLTARLGIEQPGVARTLAGLEAGDLIRRKALKGRAQGLYLTARATALLPAARAAAARAEQAVLGGLSRTEAAQLIDDMALLADAIPR